MMTTRIIADSSVDTLKMEGVDFAAVPLTIATKERSFTDNAELDAREMLAYLAAYRGRSYTACPPIKAWMDCYEGADIVYVATLTSGLSGTYGAAVTAAELYREKNPEVQIRVFDTRSAGPELRLLVEYIARCVREGQTFEKVCAAAEEYLRHTRIFFALESFHNFVQNGRVNKFAAAAAGMLGVRILATASTDGLIEIFSKCRGEKATIRGFLTAMDEAGYAGGRVYIAQCENRKLAEAVAAGIRARYAGAEIRIYETRGLCSYYAERGGILLSCECEKIYE